jgi:hemerythrin-like domain-containing protein
MRNHSTKNIYQRHHPQHIKCEDQYAYNGFKRMYQHEDCTEVSSTQLPISDIHHSTGTFLFIILYSFFP